ncbi:MAG: AAA family ATPase [Pseudomonadota bacterium]|nr:AAA family ATPase [Gammaproteobacteria bacterium]MDQ3580817.1 AAA family ATPase [Pseudomonadota bacterium]
MYLAHFGLREAPFSLTPDPRFLYLGERHREGLAHLRYGLEDGGGFVQLTGEIGTGKTTLCRALLAELPGHLDVAFLLNPRVSEVDLLASLCDELRIPYSESEARQKPLVDALYRHLLEAHAGGRTTVLLIDEAQNLSPPVLEQVRLLTNLETTKKKLLQIILIGQPELCEVLARSELRQLAQRITARYHLVPFSRPETFDYIAHRIEVAGGSPRVFSPKARSEVYRQSKGVPRLINVFCDRALLGAYVQEQASVDIATARRAIGEVRGIPAPRIGRRVFAAAAGLCVTAAVSFWLYGNPPGALGLFDAGGTPSDVAPLPDTNKGAQPAAAPPPAAPAAPAPAPPGSPVPAIPEVPAPPGFVETIGRSAPDENRTQAFAALLSSFGLQAPETAGDPCEILARDGWHCQWESGDWERLQRLGRPVMIEVRSLSGEPRFGTVSGMSGSAATLYLGRERYAVARVALESLGRGATWSCGSRPSSPGTCFVRVPRATMCCGCGSSSKRWTGPRWCPRIPLSTIAPCGHGYSRFNKAGH